MKHEVLKSMERLTLETAKLQEQLREVSNLIAELYEENHKLTIENKRLKEAYGEKLEGRSEVSSLNSQAHLEQLYEEGWHVCHTDFGKLRDHSENGCIFCLNVLRSGADNGKN